MQKFVFLERQLTELDKFVFVAMVTSLQWKPRKVQVQFCSRIKPRLHSTHSN